MTILSDIGPESWQAWNGGLHRTTQIHELLTAAGVEMRTVKMRNVPNLWKYWLGFRYLLRWGQGGASRWRLIRRYGALAASLSPALAEHRGARVLLWENTHPNNQGAVQLARSAGFAVVAVPQNLEALMVGNPAKSSRRA